MPTQKVSKADPAERLTDYARNRLCAEWAALDAERLKLERDASAKKKRQTAIAETLLGQLAVEKTSAIDLKRWQFGIELVAGSFPAMAELEKEIGAEELARRKEAVPQRERFFLRDKGAPAAKRISARLKNGKPRAA
jgi:hypothetical protein